MGRRQLAAFSVLLAILFAVGSAAQYGEEDGYGSVHLDFSGQVIAAGTCQQLAQDLIRCQVPAGSQGTIHLTAVVTPSFHRVRIFALSLPNWAKFQPASKRGEVRATCTFTPPAEAAGQSFELRFRASTAYGLSVELRVVLDVVAAQPPTGPEYPEAGYTTDEEGRFSVPVEYPPNTWVTGVLTRCTRYPLAGVPITEITLLPKPGRTTIKSLSDVGAVRISTPYGEATVREFRLLSSMDVYGRVTRTIDVGTVCLQPTQPVTPPTPPRPQPIEGTTDKEGKFSVPLPGEPKAKVIGRLTECTTRPLPNQKFTLTPIYKEGLLSGFTVSVAGYEPVTVTKFHRVSVFGFTHYLLGDICLHPQAGEEIGNGGEEEEEQVIKRCRKRTIKIYTQNTMMKPLGLPPFIRTVKIEALQRLGALLQTIEDTGADIVCLQEVFDDDVHPLVSSWWRGDAEIRGFIAPWQHMKILEWEVEPGEEVSKRQVLGEAELDGEEVEMRSPYSGLILSLDTPEGATTTGGERLVTMLTYPTKPPEPQWFDIKPGKTLKMNLGRHQLEIKPNYPKGTSKETARIAIAGGLEGEVVLGPDAHNKRQDGGLMILTKYPVVMASAFIFPKATSWDRFANKGALYARIQIDSTNQDCYIHVFNVHLQSGEGNKTIRKEQIEALVEFIELCTKDDTVEGKVVHPIILCGDFNIIADRPANWGAKEKLEPPKSLKLNINASTRSTEYHDLLDALKKFDLVDVWVQLRPKDPGFTWLGNDWKTDFPSPWGNLGNRMAEEEGMPQRLDYIFVYPGSKDSPVTLKLMKIDRVPSSQKKGAKPPYSWDQEKFFTFSDHLGLLLEIKTQ